MAPTDALPRIRKHDDAGGRYGSSRDHYVLRHAIVSIHLRCNTANKILDFP